jgi:hypothetical protein
MPKRINKLEEELVDVTPPPDLSRLEGLHERMVGRVEMLCSMLVLGIVAAADMTADETDTQMHPGITYFQALLATIRARCDLSDLVEMTTLYYHRSLNPSRTDWLVRAIV